MNQFLKELRRRRVFRTAAVYIVAAWVVLQVADLAFPGLGIPESAIRYVWLGAFLGFPLALIFSWIYEITPGGIVHTPPSDPDAAPDLSLHRVDYLVLGALGVVIVAVTYGLVGEIRELEMPELTTQRPVAPNSIAVLPFADMSPEGDQEYFSDGIAEELLNALARVPDMHVAGRTSSFSFKGKDEDLRIIGAKLGVEHILEGSVRKAGERVRITAQLVKADDGFHLWSETYDRTLDDIFAVQDEIASQIVGALRLELNVSSEVSATTNVEAYEAVLRGRHFFLQRGEAPLKAAIREFEKAIELDPDYAEAWSGLAMVYGVLYHYTTDISQLESTARSVELATKAIELGTSNGIVYSILGFGGQTSMLEAYDHYQRALDLSPNDSTLLTWYSEFLRSVGYLEEALEFAQRGYAIDPLSPVVVIDLAYVNVARRNPEAALPYAEFVWNGGLRERYVWNVKFRALVMLQRFEEALAWIEQLPFRAGEPEEHGERLRKAARAFVNVTRNKTPENHTRAVETILATEDLGAWTDSARVLAKIGEADAAFASFQRAMEQGTTGRALLFYPAWDDLRGDPRTIELIEQWGIADLWRKIGPPDYCRAVADTFECD